MSSFISPAHRAPDDFIEYVGLAPAPRDDAAWVNAADRIALAENWESELLPKEVQIFPPLHVPVSASGINEDMRKALSSCTEKPMKRAKKEAAVRVLNPDAECGTDSEESAEDPGLPDVALQHIQGEADVPHDVPQAEDDRPDRTHPFGPWTVSEIWSKKRGCRLAGAQTATGISTAQAYHARRTCSLRRTLRTSAVAA